MQKKNQKRSGTPGGKNVATRQDGLKWVQLHPCTMGPLENSKSNFLQMDIKDG